MAIIDQGSIWQFVEIEEEAGEWHFWHDAQKKKKKKKTGQTEHTQRKTYKLASAEDSDMLSPKWKATTISTNLPSQLSRLPSQAELEGEQTFFSLF